MSFNSEVVLDYREDEVIYLNDTLILHQGLSEESIRRLKWSHRFKYALLQRMKSARDAKDIEIMGRLFSMLLFYQQKLWGFDQDEMMHNWTEIPHCSCPETVQGGPHVIAQNCPVHGHRFRQMYENIGENS